MKRISKIGQQPVPIYASIAPINKGHFDSIVMTEKPIKKVPAIYRTVNVMEYIAKNQRVSLSDIYKNLHLAKSSAYLIIMSMTETGLLKKNPDNTFSLGTKLYELGSQAVAHLNLTSEAWPFMKKLRDQTQLTVHIGFIDGIDAIYLSKIDGLKSIIPNTWEGKRLSLHSSSLGKVLMAWMGETELEATLAYLNFNANTPHTLTTQQALRDELHQVRQHYVAFDHEEDVIGIACIASPIFDYHGSVIAGISVSGTCQQMREMDQTKLADTVREQACAISQAMGYQGNGY